MGPIPVVLINGSHDLPFPLWSWPVSKLWLPVILKPFLVDFTSVNILALLDVNGADLRCILFLLPCIDLTAFRDGAGLEFFPLSLVSFSFKGFGGSTVLCQESVWSAAHFALEWGIQGGHLGLLIGCGGRQQKKDLSIWALRGLGSTYTHAVSPGAKGWPELDT